jgi:nicotinate-nucleotide pyrophosphorylase (carboxylating)
MKLLLNDYSAIVRATLKEDAIHRDVTSLALIEANQNVKAYIFLKEDAVVCGIDIAAFVFRNLNKSLKIKLLVKDGSFVRRGTKVLTVTGRARSILAAERTALNFLGHLSGISTLTRRFVSQVKGHHAKILDTRKTTPGLRCLEKYAVEKGGGVRHRMDLSDMILVKDNHKLILKKSKNGFVGALKRLRQKTRQLMEVEVESLEELRYIIEASPDIILLDNMSLTDIKKAVQFIKSDEQTKQIQLEVSGGVKLENVRKIAETGVDRISIGALTHSAKSIDFSLEII